MTFVAGTAESLHFDESFDAVVGRYVLQFQGDSASLLRSVVSLARPGAPIVFHELDWSGVASDPPVEAYDRLAEWLSATIERSGATAYMGLRLPSTFVDAGFGDPQVRLEQNIGIGSTAGDVVDRLVNLARTLEEAMAEYGIVGSDELGLDTLAERIMSEAIARHSVLRSHLQVAAWSAAHAHSSTP